MLGSVHKESTNFVNCPHILKSQQPTQDSHVSRTHFPTCKEFMQLLTKKNPLSSEQSREILIVNRYKPTEMNTNALPFHERPVEI